MKSYFFPAFRLLLVMTVVTGVLYPLFLTVLSQTLFPYQANGSMIEKNGVIIGSELVGQLFLSDRYFHSRPSAIGYQPLPSSGTNWGPTDKRMADSAAARRIQFVERNNLPTGTTVPKEMLFSSGSGVDPHISPESAVLQMKRVADARGFDAGARAALYGLVQRYTERPQFELFGEPRVNVVKLNIALDLLPEQR